MTLAQLGLVQYFPQCPPEIAGMPASVVPELSAEALLSQRKRLRGDILHRPQQNERRRLPDQGPIIILHTVS